MNCQEFFICPSADSVGEGGSFGVCHTFVDWLFVSSLTWSDFEVHTLMCKILSHRRSLRCWTLRPWHFFNRKNLTNHFVFRLPDILSDIFAIIIYVHVYHKAYMFVMFSIGFNLKDNVKVWKFYRIKVIKVFSYIPFNPIIFKLGLKPREARLE